MSSFLDLDLRGTRREVVEKMKAVTDSRETHCPTQFFMLISNLCLIPSRILVLQQESVLHCRENAALSVPLAIETRGKCLTHEYSQVQECPRVELSKRYRMSPNWAWTEIVYRTQQVEFDRRGIVRNLNDEHCHPQKKAKEEYSATLLYTVRQRKERAFI